MSPFLLAPTPDWRYPLPVAGKQFPIVPIAHEAGTRYRSTTALRASTPGRACRVQFGNAVLRLSEEHAPNGWHTLTTAFVANQNDGNV